MSCSPTWERMCIWFSLLHLNLPFGHWPNSNKIYNCGKTPNFIYNLCYLIYLNLSSNLFIENSPLNVDNQTYICEFYHLKFGKNNYQGLIILFQLNLMNYRLQIKYKKLMTENHKLCIEIIHWSLRIKNWRLDLGFKNLKIEIKNNDKNKNLQYTKYLLRVEG